MKKTDDNISTVTCPATASSVPFLSFCRALDRYCDQIGVTNRRFSAVRILHAAACNTMAQMHTVTIAQRRHMARMERNIPQMFTGVIEISTTDGFLSTIERLSVLSLAQLSDTVAQKSHKR